MTVAELRRIVVEETLSWVGTRYRQNCMQKGKGADCARTGIRGFHVAGLIPWHMQPPIKGRDRLLAGEYVDPNLFRDFIIKCGGVPVPYDERMPADIATFRYLGVESHIGILVERDWMVDAVSGGRVRKRPLTKINSLVAIYRHKHLFETATA